MPYITQQDRRDINGVFCHSEGRDPQTVGELNYCITVLLRNYINTYKPSYSTFNDCLGVLEAAKLELYRRCIAPYEETKMNENGDVYE